MGSNSVKRFTVARAQIPKKEGFLECYLILDNGIPAVEINNAIMMQGKDYPRSPSTPRYHLATFLNYLNERNVEYQDATMEQIYNFLQEKYMYEDISYSTLIKYIDIIGCLYEKLALFNVALDKSLFLELPGSQVNTPRVSKGIRHNPQTKIYYLKNQFMPRKADAWLSYTKWYTREQYRALAEALPLVHRIIFLMTVFLGYRSDSALSVKLSGINLRTKTIEPSHTKTGQTHVSVLKDELVQLIRSYMQNERAKNKGCDSDWLFLNNRGKQMKYHSYCNALKRAAKKVRMEHPELELGPVHTHAGRSTFAATLRSFQLHKRRLGEKVFTDEDFCRMMDWKSLNNLKYYDKATRVLETATIHEEFYSDFDETLGSVPSVVYRQK